MPAAELITLFATFISATGLIWLADYAESRHTPERGGGDTEPSAPPRHLLPVDVPPTSESSAPKHPGEDTAKSSDITWNLSPFSKPRKSIQ
jgi:hypothetical protein